MNPNHHRLSARLVAAVYKKDTDDLLLELHGLGLENVKIIDGPGPLFERAVVGDNGDVRHVCFMGTRNAAQWVSNVDCRKVPFVAGHGSEVHSGFAHGLETIIDLVFEAVRGARFIIVSGHSRGAAFASQFALAARIAGKRVSEVHLFGCPRTFNVAGSHLFNRYFAGNCWSWVSNNDAVFRFPLRSWGFRHVGGLMYLDHKGRLVRGATLRDRIKGQVLGRISGGIFDGISDHSAAGEYARLVGGLSFDAAS